LKTHLFRTCILAIAAAVAGSAQNISFRVSVPFNFIVGSETLPAGQYFVDVQAPSGLVALHCLDHEKSGAEVGLPIGVSTDSNTSRLVFNRYNNANTYFLSKVWGLNGYGRGLPMTKREHELATHKSARASVIVVASR
jgi:hypothetical protein